MLFQIPQALFPEVAIVLEPPVGKTQPCRLHAVHPLLADLCITHQPCIFQNTKVFGNGRPADWELLCQLRNVDRPDCDLLKYHASRRICQRPENKCGRICLHFCSLDLW